MLLPIRLPAPSSAERTPLVEALLGRIEHLLAVNRQQAETIQQLRDEIAVLKGEQGKPDFKASGMEKKTEPDASHDTSSKDPNGGDSDAPNKRPGSSKRPKTSQLTIHQETKIAPPSRCRRDRAARATRMS